MSKSVPRYYAIQMNVSVTGATIPIGSCNLWLIDKKKDIHGLPFAEEDGRPFGIADDDNSWKIVKKGKINNISELMGYLL